MAEQVGEEETEAAEVTEETPVEEPKSDMQVEVENLRRTNEDQRQRINKYDGERSDMSSKINTLVEEVAEMRKSKTVEVEEELDYDEPVTKSELKRFEAEETKRFEAFNEKKKQENSAYNDQYTKGFATASTNVTDDDLNEILKEHDALQSSGKMPKSTGDPGLDARIAYEKSENAFLKKRLAAESGEVKSFNQTPSSAKLGVGSGNLGNDIVKTHKSMPKLPDDAQQLVSDLGEDADFANAALGKR